MRNRPSSPYLPKFLTSDFALLVEVASEIYESDSSGRFLAVAKHDHWNLDFTRRNFAPELVRRKVRKIFSAHVLQRDDGLGTELRHQYECRVHGTEISLRNISDNADLHAQFVRRPQSSMMIWVSMASSSIVPFAWVNEIGDARQIAACRSIVSCCNRSDTVRL
jgi:hypothetical protein